MINEFGGVIFTDALANRPPEEWELQRPIGSWIPRWPELLAFMQQAAPREGGRIVLPYRRFNALATPPK